MVAPSSGGTTVSLVLSLSTISENDYLCKFNDTQVPAKVQDDLSISYLVPPARAKGGLVPLELQGIVLIFLLVEPLECISLDNSLSHCQSYLHMDLK